MKKFLLPVSILSVLFACGDLLAAEASLVSGLYRSSEEKVGGTSQGKETIMNAGGRYSDELSTYLFWFGEGALTLKSYTSGPGGNSPSNSTGLSAGGGVRYYFNKFSEAISPYGYGKGLFKNEKEVIRTGTSNYVETATNGLFYSGHLGVRFSLSPDFFFEVETQMFESALFATEESESVIFTTDANGGVTRTSSKSERNRTELFAETQGAFASMVVVIGMRL